MAVPRRYPKSMSLDSPWIIIYLYAVVYAFDLVSILFRRSTDRVRNLHYWIEKVPPLYPANSKASIVEKSKQYLPGVWVLVGSFPRYSAVVSMVSVIQYLSAHEFWKQLLVGMICYFVVDYVLSQVLRGYCISRSNSEEKL